MKPKKYVVVDPVKCTGCSICEFVCSEGKKKAYNPKESRIRVVQLNVATITAISCVLCEDPICVMACSRKALFQNDAGVIAVDEEKCNGCGLCVQACKFGAVMVSPIKGTVMICDLCNGDPKCVSLCPAEALSIANMESMKQKIKEAATLWILISELEKSEKKNDVQILWI